MAKQTNITKASVCYKAGMILVALIFTFALASCGKEVTPPQVTQTVSRTKVYDKGTFRIKKVSPDGTVFVGKPDQEGSISDFIGYRLHLRGNARVGDAFAMIVYIDDRLFSNGKIETRITKIEVVSKQSEEYEKYFKNAKGEGKPPENKNQAENILTD